MDDKLSRMWALISKYRNRLAVLTAALLFLISWILTYFLTASQLDANSKAAWIAVVAALVNLGSTAAVFVVASVLFDREDDAKWGDTLRQIILETQDRPVDLSQVRFTDLIDSAKEIDFVVQGWNGWAAQQNIEKSLTNFFERGGVFRLYVCNPDSEKAQPNRNAMERRLGRSPGQISEEIRGTIQTITDARDLATTSKRNLGKLEVFQTDELNWYFAAYFRSAKSSIQARGLNILILSVYSHSPGTPPWAMPALQVPLDQYSRLQAWFDRELEHLRDGTPRPSSSSAAEAEAKEITS